MRYSITADGQDYSCSRSHCLLASHQNHAFTTCPCHRRASFHTHFSFFRPALQLYAAAQHLLEGLTNCSNADSGHTVEPPNVHVIVSFNERSPTTTYSLLVIPRVFHDMYTRCPHPPPSVVQTCTANGAYFCKNYYFWIIISPWTSLTLMEKLVVKTKKKSCLFLILSTLCKYFSIFARMNFAATSIERDYVRACLFSIHERGTLGLFFQPCLNMSSNVLLCAFSTKEVSTKWNYAVFKSWVASS